MLFSWLLSTTHSGAQSEVIDLNAARARLFPLKQTLVSSAISE